MKRVITEGKPHLCLFALKDITEGEEITYDYGGIDWPWRKQVCQKMLNIGFVVKKSQNDSFILPRFKPMLMFLPQISFGIMESSSKRPNQFNNFLQIYIVYITLTSCVLKQPQFLCTYY